MSFEINKEDSHVVIKVAAEKLINKTLLKKPLVLKYITAGFRKSL